MSRREQEDCIASVVLVSEQITSAFVACIGHDFIIDRQVHAFINILIRGLTIPQTYEEILCLCDGLLMPAIFERWDQLDNDLLLLYVKLLEGLVTSDQSPKAKEFANKCVTIYE